jgi:hypothetical protein
MDFISLIHRDPLGWSTRSMDRGIESLISLGPGEIFHQTRASSMQCKRHR